MKSYLIWQNINAGVNVGCQPAHQCNDNESNGNLRRNGSLAAAGVAIMRRPMSMAASIQWHVHQCQLQSAILKAINVNNQLA